MRNRYGVEVRLACCSCQHRTITNDGRMCRQAKTLVESSHYCGHWQMHPKLQNAGEGSGQVKRLAYLDYFRKQSLRQREDLIDGKILPTQMRSAEQIRKEYTEQNGSVYINI